VAASVAANVLHAEPNPISQTIAAWPPVALLVTVELISRVPVHRRALAAVRLAATTLIAGIAAWVSYWHMVGVAARYGETGASPYLLPLSVDGLVVVASVCLVELAGRIASAERPATATQPVAATRPAPAVAPAPTTTPATAPAPVVAATRRPRVNPVRHDIRQRARDMYRDGVRDLAHIATTLGVSKRSVERYTQDLRQAVAA